MGLASFYMNDRLRSLLSGKIQRICIFLKNDVKFSFALALWIWPGEARVQEGLVAEAALPRSILAGYRQTLYWYTASLGRTFNPVSACALQISCPPPVHLTGWSSCYRHWETEPFDPGTSDRVLVVEHLQRVGHCIRCFIHSFNPQRDSS